MPTVSTREAQEKHDTGIGKTTARLYAWLCWYRQKICRYVEGKVVEGPESTGLHANVVSMSLRGLVIGNR